MLYFTGDMHGEIERFDRLRETHPDMGGGDHLIVCGDFGFLFFNDEAEAERLDRIARLPYTVCFIDGNHENFAALNALPIERWNGGNVHKLRPNVIHLMRGQVFDIEGRSVFTMGGAYSVDRYMRRQNVTYWAEELPSNDDYREASANLARVGRNVDIVVSHTAPAGIIRQMGYSPNVHEAELAGFLDWVMCDVGFGEWFFGHWHVDLDFDNIHALLYRVVECKKE